MAETFLDKVHDTMTPEELRVLYDTWSHSYDAETTQNGYATPVRAARALAKHMPDGEAPILDFGCGTGLCGRALKYEGFEVIDGCDVSPEMLAIADKKDLYRNLSLVTPDAATGLTSGAYAAITAIGVLGSNCAPVSLIGPMMSTLVRGGKLVFSLNDHARKRRGTMAFLNEQLDTGHATLLHAKHGTHLPGIDLKSTVYILEKN